MAQLLGVRRHRLDLESGRADRSDRLGGQIRLGRDPGRAVAADLVDHPTRSVRRLVRSGAPELPEQELSVDLRLRGPAHRRRDADQLVPAQHHHGHERVARALARGEGVGGCGIERERGAAVLEDDAGLGLEDVRAEAPVDGVDQRDRPAVRADGGEADGVAARLHCPVDRFTAADRAGGRCDGDQLLAAQRAEAGVAELGGAHEIGLVERPRECTRPRAERILDRRAARAAGDRVQRAQQHEAGGVRRPGQHAQARERGLDRVAPVGGVLARILLRDPRAEPLQAGDPAIRRLALVELGRPAGGEALERLGERRLHERLALRERCAVGVEDGTGAGILRQRVLILDQCGGHRARGRMTLLGVTDRRIEVGRPRQRGTVLVQGVPAADAERHRHGVDAAQRQRGAVLLAQRLEGLAGGRGAGAVQEADLARRVSHQGDQIAAEGDVVRVDDAEGRGGGEGRVDSVAAGGEGRGAGLGGQVMGGRDRSAGAGLLGHSAACSFPDPRLRSSAVRAISRLIASTCSRASCSASSPSPSAIAA